MNDLKYQIKVTNAGTPRSSLQVAVIGDDGRTYFSEPVSLVGIDAATAFKIAFSKAQGRHEASIEGQRSQFHPLIKSEVGERSQKGA